MKKESKRVRIVLPGEEGHEGLKSKIKDIQASDDMSKKDPFGLYSNSSLKTKDGSQQKEIYIEENSEPS